MKTKKSSFIILILIIFQITLFTSCSKEKKTGKPKVIYVRVLENWGPVNSAYTTYLETTFNDIKEMENVIAVIIEIDTPGGSVKDAEKIVKLINSLNMTTVSYITNSAYSAGAMLSLATTYTAMAPHAKVGAMEPVMMDRRTKQMKTAPEKIISAMRASMRGVAEKRRKRILKEHDQERRKIQNLTWIKNLPDIAAAMVDKSITLNKKEHGIKLAKDKLLTITNEEAKKIGFSYYTAKNIKTLLEKMKFANYKIVEIRPKLKHVFIHFSQTTGSQ